MLAISDMFDEEMHLSQMPLSCDCTSRRLMPEEISIVLIVIASQVCCATLAMG
jgi:hypothetical protein